MENTTPTLITQRNRPAKILSHLALAATMGFGLSNMAIAHEGTAGRADSHAPISVMGDHMHKKGEVMFSLRYMSMSMSGNIQGSDDIDDDTIVTTIANRFAGMPNMPPTLRIVPQTMDGSMIMPGMMYAPSDRVTLMLMANYINKDMRLKTYQGGMGTMVRGYFETNSSGWGDTKIAALVSAVDTGSQRLHFTIGLSLPTGAIDQRDGVLPPMNMNSGMSMNNDMLMDMRLPYAMQLGSGTYDFEPAMTYTGNSARVSWGAQYKAVVHIGENSEDYSLGDSHQVQGWGQYLFAPAISASLRLSGKTVAKIDGIDSQIMGPVQSADPSNYGGNYVDFGAGINLLGQKGWVTNHRLAFEYTLPVIQDVNGVQMKKQSMLSIGYQYAF